MVQEEAMETAVRIRICGILLGLVSAPTRVSANYLENASTGAATVVANVFYVPTKLAYAALGGITGSFASLLTGRAGVAFLFGWRLHPESESCQRPGEDLF